MFVVGTKQLPGEVHHGGLLHISDFGKLAVTGAKAGYALFVPVTELSKMMPANLIVFKVLVAPIRLGSQDYPKARGVSQSLSHLTPAQQRRDEWISDLLLEQASKCGYAGSTEGGLNC